jgi:hypothetical protein
MACCDGRDDGQMSDDPHDPALRPAAKAGTGTIDGACWRPGDPNKHLGPSYRIVEHQSAAFYASRLFSTRCGLGPGDGPWLRQGDWGQGVQWADDDDVWCPACLEQAGIAYELWPDDELAGRGEVSREQQWPAWDGEDDDEDDEYDDEERIPQPRLRPPHAPSRDDGWRRRVQAPPPPRGRVDVEQHLWRHCAESGALAIAVTLFAAWVLPASAPVGYVAAGGGALTAAIWYTSRKTTGSRVMAGYLAAWGVLVTAWFTWVRLTTPWHSLQISVLVITGLVLAVLGAPAIGHHRQRISAEEAQALDLEATRPLRDWERTLAANGAPGCTVLDVRKFKDGGEEVRGRLPRSTRERQAITFSELAATAEKIAVSKRRNPDGVYFSQPELGDASEFILHVRAKRVAQRAPVHLPAENKVLSINSPLAVGVYDNGRPYRVTLREIHVTIFGTTRSGKSNLMNVFLTLLAACPDALIWMIDMKGGKTSRPWVTPWLKDFTPHPVIDWVATTREEAKTMLESALTVVRTRAAYPGFEKIIPDEDVPALLLLCDDVSACFGHGKRDNGISNYGLSQLGAEFTELAGGEAGVLIGAGQRANVELWGGTGMKAQSELRFGLRATSIGDAGQIFENAQAAKMLTRLRDKGDCLVMHGPDISEVVHLYRVGSEERITSRAEWAGEIRPELEQRAAAALGEAYEKRWERCEDLLQAWRESAGIAPKPDFDDEFGEIVARLNDPEKPVSPHRQRAREIVRKAGWAGIKVGDVWNRLCETGDNPPRRETVQRWFADDEQMGLMVRGQRGSQRWRWANLDDDDLPGAM